MRGPWLTPTAVTQKDYIMNSFFKKLALAAAALLGIGVGAVQAQTLTQQSPTHLDAAVLTVASTAAVNTALTLTLPAVSGQYHYITSIDLRLCQDTTASTSLQLAVTSTNLNGWLTQIGQASAAGSCSDFPSVYPNGLKSAAPGTATVVTIAQPGTHGAAIGNINYYVGS